MKTTSTFEPGDLAVITGEIGFDNDFGGTELVSGSFEVRIERAWWDDETGQRYVASLLNESDVDALREKRKTTYSPKKPFDGRRVYYVDGDVRPLSSAKGTEARKIKTRAYLVGLIKVLAADLEPRKANCRNTLAGIVQHASELLKDCPQPGPHGSPEKR